MILNNYFFILLEMELYSGIYGKSKYLILIKYLLIY
jgi:hypothetical protein